MRLTIAICAAALTLTACNKAEPGNTTAINAEETAADNAAMSGDIDNNAMTNDAVEANKALTDLTHNDADTNLANGM